MPLTAALHESEGHVVQHSVSGGSGGSACRNSDVELVEVRRSQGAHTAKSGVDCTATQRADDELSAGHNAVQEPRRAHF